jgi:site-specific DNA-methyltransferase (adenine-specific)
MDVWFVRGGSDKNHPAVFPLEIPTRLIKLYTFPGELVFDMHNGSGTTTAAAETLGRRFVGVDSNPVFCKQAKDRTSCAKSPAQNTIETCHTSPNSASPKAAQISMELEL